MHNALKAVVISMDFVLRTLGPFLGSYFAMSFLAGVPTTRKRYRESFHIFGLCQIPPQTRFFSLKPGLAVLKPGLFRDCASGRPGLGGEDRDTSPEVSERRF